MRTLVKIALVALGIRAFLRWRKGRREKPAVTTVASTAADPADELRRKLAESREGEGADTTQAEPEHEASVADRRAVVHEQGRATLDEMTSDEA